MSGGRVRGKRPVWTLLPDGAWSLGSWVVLITHPGTSKPWGVTYRGSFMTRAHGNCTGYQRFMNADNAKRWIEQRRSFQRHA